MAKPDPPIPPSPPQPPQKPSIAVPAPATSPPTLQFTSCSSDAAALALLPKRRPDVDPVQSAPGGPIRMVPRVRPPDTWFPERLAPSAGNDVIGYIYGRCAFQDLAAALATAQSDDHRIYIIGWNCEKKTELTPGKTLEEYLKGTRAQIRAMFHDGIAARLGAIP